MKIRRFLYLKNIIANIAILSYLQPTEYKTTLTPDVIKQTTEKVDY